MKKIFLFFAMGLIGFSVNAQITTLTFSGKDANYKYVRLDSVVITNHTKSWQETIYYPDTILIMGGIGIEEYGITSRFALLQNIPNPFSGVSDFSLQLPEDNVVTISVFDLNGRKITELQQTLSRGTHVFRVFLSTPQTYLLSVNGGTDHASIKIINTGNAGKNRVEYLSGGSEMPVTYQLKSAKGETANPFDLGDSMEYVGYATNNGVEVESEVIRQLQTGSQNFVLLFNVATLYLPGVTSASATSITQITATCGGNVTFDGNTTVTSRGVCWNTSQNPTTADSHTTDGSGTGGFTSSLIGLTANTTYYVRAYATNSVGTVYGNEVSFTTLVEDGQPCSGTPTLSDADGNTYNTVQIGTQCWMKENLKTTKYSNDTIITFGSIDNATTTVAYRYYPDDNSSNVSIYGYLYNWAAVMGGSGASSANPSGVQGICPTGWHVPSDAEWKQLIDYVSSQSQYVCGNDSIYIAKALASTTGWNSDSHTCAVGSMPSINNVTGFSALPAGYYDHYFYNFGHDAIFSSATQRTDNLVYSYFLTYYDAYVNRAYNYKFHSYSVRCVRD